MPSKKLKPEDKASKIKSKSSRSEAVKTKKIEAKKPVKTQKLNDAVKVSKSSSKKEITPVKGSDSLHMEFYDMKGKTGEKMDLPKEIFDVKINKVLVAQAVRVYLANQR